MLFRLFGLFLLRLAERALSWLLFHDPPRSTRVKSTGGPHRLCSRPDHDRPTGNPTASANKTGTSAHAPVGAAGRGAFSGQGSEVGDTHHPKTDAAAPVVRTAPVAVG